MSKDIEFKGDFPEVEQKKSNKPRLHISDQSCITCEG